MSTDGHPTPDASAHAPRVRELFEQRYRDGHVRTDRMFAWLLFAEWIAGIGLALWFSPYAWSGATQRVHEHVLAATILGGVISAFPIALVLLQPGERSTRTAVACAQMLWSALLIHLTGGRIETHFHVFGSLAILAFYRDPMTLGAATVVVALDHFLRGVFWPESVYGETNPEWWRFVEHAGWVLFIDAFLVANCLQSRREMYEIARQQIVIEESNEAAVRMARLAAVGQLAASVGHELRNPLTAVRNARTFVKRKLTSPDAPTPADPKVVHFLDLMGRELDATEKIIANLLDFSRPRAPTFSPCALRPLVSEAIEIVPPRADVVVHNEVPEELPMLDVDRDQLRQVLVNLVQNAVEAMPKARAGTVRVQAQGGGPSAPCVIRVIDDGPGIPESVRAKVMQPLFSTKAKGTGLGLAIAASVIERHGGRLSLDTAEGRGTTFTIELPPRTHEPGVENAEAAE